MKKPFLAKLIPSSEILRKFWLGIFLTGVFLASLIIFFLIYTAATARASDEPGERIEDSVVTAPSQETLDRVREAVNSFQAATPPDQMQGWKKRAENITRERFCEEAAATGRDGGPDCLPALPQQDGDAVAAQQQEDPKASDVSGGNVAKTKGTVYYFFSFSMPGESLQQALQDADRLQKEGQKVVMVIRGFVGNDLFKTAMAFEKLKRESGVDKDLPVDIDPPLFKKYGITEIPVTILAGPKQTGRTTGDVGIPYSLSRFDKEMENYGKVGHTYEIIEQDLMEFVASKQPMIEAKVKERIKVIRKEMFVLKKYDGTFAKATKTRMYNIDPALVLKEDVLDHNGKVLFPKGSRFDPTDHASLGRYIVIDGHDPAQVKLALTGDYRKVMIISGDVEKLATKHHKQFWFVTDAILERFKIKRVPLIFEQEGKLIRVTEKAL